MKTDSVECRATLWKLSPLETDSEGRLRNKAGQLKEVLTIGPSDEHDTVNRYIVSLMISKTNTDRVLWSPHQQYIVAVIGSRLICIYDIQDGVTVRKLIHIKDLNF